MFLYGYKLEAGQRVCTSLTAQGKVNSLEGHSLICLGGLESQAACNLSQSAVLERERQRSPALSCLFPSLLLFYQHLSERRSPLAYPAIHHSCSSRPVLSFFSILDPAKTKNIKTNIKEERERETDTPSKTKEMCYFRNCL